ncbi:MAG: DUF1499 domain-containing protein [Erythrobacter sp.]|nr:MAG: DUF1499 domain-containing protein [Erythrobacter sp.]
MDDQTLAGEPAPATSPATPQGSKLIRWTGNFVLGGALILVTIVLVAATLARFDIIDKLAGFGPFYLSLNPARALTVIGIVALIIAFVRKTGGGGKLALGTILAGGLTVAVYVLLVIPAGKVPPIHDITTNLNTPPQFVELDRPPVSTGPFSQEEWRAFHEGAYADIQPILIDKAPEVVLADAQALMEDRGWEVAAYDAAAGRLEATATAGYVRFYDDVVLMVTPVADGSTRVDMRSVSRVGVSDVGYNAARIREFLADLQAV